jgi:hypothetical protein
MPSSPSKLPRAEAGYRNDPELTAFDAFGAEDL